MTVPTLSIAMATFNGEAYLWQQLETINNQTIVPFELVVCDDASTDGTVELIELFKAKAKFPVRLYRNSDNVGSTKNFEKAIRLCDGDIIVLADQDDIWREDKLCQITTAFGAAPGCVAVFSDARLIDGQETDLGETLWRRIGITRRVRNVLSSGGRDALRALLKRTRVTGATLAFRATFRKHILPIPACWVHDAWIAQCLVAFGGIVGLDAALIDYRQHSRNQIGVRSRGIAERATESAYLEKVQAQAESALAHINNGDGSWPTYLHKLVREQLGHVRMRLASRGAGLIAFPHLLVDLFCGRYHRYSNGVFSFMKDVAKL